MAVMTEENKMVFDEILLKFKSNEEFEVEDLKVDNQLIERIKK